MPSADGFKRVIVGVSDRRLQGGEIGVPRVSSGSIRACRHLEDRSFAVGGCAWPHVCQLSRTWLTRMVATTAQPDVGLMALTERRPDDIDRQQPLHSGLSGWSAATHTTQSQEQAPCTSCQEPKLSRSWVHVRSSEADLIASRPLEQTGHNDQGRPAVLPGLQMFHHAWLVQLDDDARFGNHG